MKKKTIRMTMIDPQQHEDTAKPLVSIIILNYNGENFIRRCLQTVLQDPYPNKEVILVDNRSSDNSMQIAENEFSDQIRIVMNQRNYGFPKGCNKGIQVANGEIIVLLNIDTAVRENWLDELVKPLLHDPWVGMVGSKLLFLNGKTIQFAGGRIEPNCLTQHDGYGYEDSYEFNSPRDVQYLTGASVAIRKDLLDYVGGMDPHFPLYFEDVDLSVRISQLGYKLRYQPTSVVLHFETYGTQKNSFTYFYKYHRGRLRFLLKNFGFRYFLIKFIPRELRWYGSYGIKNQFMPVLCAYVTQLYKAPYFWILGFIKRRILSYFYKKPIPQSEQEQAAPSS